MAERDSVEAPGIVFLVGAGPGDPELITLRGLGVLQRADVIVHDSLVAPALLDRAPARAERIDVGKRGHDAPTREQGAINTLLIERARAGAVVVRLKGGDPFVYGRGGEEVSACRAAGVRVEVIPGVSSAIAAPAAAGIPLTDRRYGSSVAITTGHRDRERPWTAIDWERLARGADTVVVLMGMRNLEKIVAGLIEHGRPPETPAAVVMEGTTRQQRVVVAALEDLPREVRRGGLRAPAAIVVGDVVRLREDWRGNASAAEGDAAPVRFDGRSVVLTRPVAPDDAVSRALLDAGAVLHHIPMIEIHPLPDPREIDRVLSEPDAFAAWFFTSAHAVSLTAAHLERLGHVPRSLDAPVYCVGPASADRARAVGFSDVRVPDEARDAEALAAFWIARGAAVTGPLLFPRARDAREALPSRLREAGVELVELELYRTAPARPSAAEMRRMARADALLFASPSAVHAFADARGPASGDLPALISAIGPRTAGALAERGLRCDVVASRPDAKSWIAALGAHFSA